MSLCPIFIELDTCKDVFKMSKGEARFDLSCQVLEQRKETHQENIMPQTVVQLQQALEQISNISTALSDIQLYYQEQVTKESLVILDQNEGTFYFLHHIPSFSYLRVQVKPNQSAVEESGVLSELQNLREQLEKSEKERKSIETQLSEANSTVTKLQEEGSCQQRIHCTKIFLTKQSQNNCSSLRVKGND